MTWPAAVLLVIACGVVALWWLCRYLARQDADEAHANLAQLLAEQAGKVKPAAKKKPAKR